MLALRPRSLAARSQIGRDSVRRERPRQSATARESSFARLPRSHSQPSLEPGQHLSHPTPRPRIRPPAFAPWSRRSAPVCAARPPDPAWMKAPPKRGAQRPMSPSRGRALAPPPPRADIDRLRQALHSACRRLIRKGEWQVYGDASLPLHVDLGCGKGRMLLEMAKLHPERNFLGLKPSRPALLAAALLPLGVRTTCAWPSGACSHGPVSRPCARAMLNAVMLKAVRVHARPKRWQVWKSGNLSWCVPTGGCARRASRIFTTCPDPSTFRCNRCWPGTLGPSTWCPS